MQNEGIEKRISNPLSGADLLSYLLLTAFFVARIRFLRSAGNPSNQAAGEMDAG